MARKLTAHLASAVGPLGMIIVFELACVVGWCCFLFARGILGACCGSRRSVLREVLDCLGPGSGVCHVSVFRWFIG